MQPKRRGKRAQRRAKEQLQAEAAAQERRCAELETRLANADTVLGDLRAAAAAAAQGSEARETGARAAAAALEEQREAARAAAERARQAQLEADNLRHAVRVPVMALACVGVLTTLPKTCYNAARDIHLPLLHKCSA